MESGLKMVTFQPLYNIAEDHGITGKSRGPNVAVVCVLNLATTTDKPTRHGAVLILP